MAEKIPVRRPTLRTGRFALSPARACYINITANQQKPRGWHSRGYLPHLDGRDLLQGISFRLADSVPTDVIARWRREVGVDRSTNEAIRKRISRYEDSGFGECLLSDPANARIVEHALQFFNGERYRLLAWVVMPNHVHVLIKQMDEPLDRIVKSWKTHTAREIHQRIGRTGSFWARDYFDRYIRDQDHFNLAVSYIRNNPVKAGLCESPDEWPFGSASWERRFSDRHSDG